MQRRCAWCGVGIVTSRADARFCSSKHRVYAYRAGAPLELVSRDRWVRYAAADKRPLTVAGKAASSTDPSTWSSFAAARASRAGAGLGFVLGDGIGCIDLDHCLVEGRPTPEASTFLEQYAGHYIEISPSGDGLHIWGLAEPQRGFRRNVDGLSIERYSSARYITVTGRVFQRGELLPL